MLFAQRCNNCAAHTRLPSSTAPSRIALSARGAARRWWSASGRKRIFWLRMRSRWRVKQSALSFWKTAMSLNYRGYCEYYRFKRRAGRTGIARIDQPSSNRRARPFQHFMQKEIFEQPRALAESIAQRDTFLPSCFGERARAVFERIDRALILACGSSYYAGLTAKYWLESIAALPTQVEIASEYRYRSPVPHPDTLVVAISQSGETADTLAALKYAHALGQAQSLAICNVATSAMVRQTALSFLTRAGAEIGVASTKAFTAQLAALFILTVTLGKVRARVAPSAEDAYRQRLRHLPVALDRVLALEPHLIAWAETFAGKENALFLGRGMHYPIALEGALKLKEISYIHAEAYPAGELKHGPLALVTDAMPVVAIAPNDALLEKLKSNLHEVRARGGQLYALAEPETRIDSDIGLRAIRMPEHEGPLSPLLHAVALQLLAYHTARARGTDIDKPRNLAKSVTVEKAQWNGSSAFFSKIAEGTSAKTVCTIRQARSDAVQAAENALDRQANGARILTNQIRAAQHLLALIREQFKL